MQLDNLLGIFSTWVYGNLTPILIHPFSFLKYCFMPNNLLLIFNEKFYDSYT